MAMKHAKTLENQHLGRLEMNLKVCHSELFTTSLFDFAFADNLCCT